MEPVLGLNNNAGLYLCQFVGCFCSAFGFARGIAEGKDDRTLIVLCHRLNEPLCESASDGSRSDRSRRLHDFTDVFQAPNFCMVLGIGRFLWCNASTRTVLQDKDGHRMF